MKKNAATLLKKNKGQIGLHIFFIIMSLTYIVPLMLVISASLTTEDSLTQSGFSILPREFTIQAYEMIFASPEEIFQGYKVTISFSVINCLLSVLVMTLVAYPLSRPTFRLRHIITFYLFFTTLFNAGLVPTYLNMVDLGLKNNFWVYVFPSLVSVWSVIVIRTSMQGVPTEMIESAKIDGAGELRICFQIVIPVAKATIASVLFLDLVGNWNNWQTPLYYIRNRDLYSLQYILQMILENAEFLKSMAESGDASMYQGMMPSETLRYAMAIGAAGPMLVIFPFFQKYFSKGMTIGSVKG